MDTIKMVTEMPESQEVNELFTQIEEPNLSVKIQVLKKKNLHRLQRNRVRTSTTIQYRIKGRFEVAGIYSTPVQ